MTTMRFWVFGAAGMLAVVFVACSTAHRGPVSGQPPSTQAAVASVTAIPKSVAVASSSPQSLPSFSPAPVPSFGATSEASPLPQASGGSAPLPQPSASIAPASPQPSLSPTSAPLANTHSANTMGVKMLPPDAPPEIVHVAFNALVIHPGDLVAGTIVTSSNVASVELRVATFSMNVPKVGVGRFALSYTVPPIPFFLHRTYELALIARNTHGDAAQKTIPITLR